MELYTHLVRTKAAIGSVFTLVCVTFAVGAHGGRFADQAVLEQRLALVREDGTACISCHRLDGLELVTSGLGRLDILRRALRHTGQQGANEVAESILNERGHGNHGSVNRQLFPVHEPAKLMRPSVGDTAFGTQVRNATPLLAGPRIADISKARAALKELIRVRPAELPTGLAMDPLSRDPIRKLAGFPLGDWVPDIPMDRVHTNEMAAQSPAILRRHTNDTSALRMEAVRLVYALQGKPVTPLGNLSYHKRAALLQYGNIWTDFIPSSQIPENPVWAVGNQLRIWHRQTVEQLGITPIECKLTGLKPGQTLQSAASAAAWFWLCFSADPTLQSTSLDPKAQSGQYLLQSLWDGGPYPWHGAFAAAMIVVQKASTRPTKALQPDLTAFVNDGQVVINAPKDMRERLVYGNWLANVLVSFALVMDDEIAQGKPVINAVGASQQLHDLHMAVTFLRKPHGEAVVNRIVMATIKRLKTFRDLQLRPR